MTTERTLCDLQLLVTPNFEVATCNFKFHISRTAHRTESVLCSFYRQCAISIQFFIYCIAQNWLESPQKWEKVKKCSYESFLLFKRTFAIGIFEMCKQFFCYRAHREFKYMQTANAELWRTNRVVN